MVSLPEMVTTIGVCDAVDVMESDAVSLEVVVEEIEEELVLEVDANDVELLAALLDDETNEEMRVDCDVDEDVDSRLVSPM
jgi:hypothetical protein